MENIGIVYIECCELGEEEPDRLHGAGYGPDKENTKVQLVLDQVTEHIVVTVCSVLSDSTHNSDSLFWLE